MILRINLKTVSFSNKLPCLSVHQCTTVGKQNTEYNSTLNLLKVFTSLDKK